MRDDVFSFSVNEWLQSGLPFGQGPPSGDSRGRDRPAMGAAGMQLLPVPLNLRRRREADAVRGATAAATDLAGGARI
jgi:hypothetical protein